MTVPLKLACPEFAKTPINAAFFGFRGNQRKELSRLVATPLRGLPTKSRGFPVTNDSATRFSLLRVQGLSAGQRPKL